MPNHTTFDYAIIRVVPHEERGEFINVGVILFCRALGYLDARITFDPRRLRALAPDLDEATVHRYLDAIPRLCAGAPEAGALAALPKAERFHWLTSPRSTVVQTSPIHPGFCDDPATMLEHLVKTLVA